MKTKSTPATDSRLPEEVRLEACERAIGGSEGVRARRLLEIRQDKLYNHTGRDYSTFEDYAAARWGISSSSHCARLCNYGRFLNSLDQQSGSSPMGEWSVFLCERAYRELDHLDVNQKQNAIIQIMDLAKTPGAVALSHVATRQLATRITRMAPSEKIGTIHKLNVTEGLPVEPRLDDVTREDSDGIEEGAMMIIRGRKSGDSESYVAGLLKILEIGPSALRDAFRCKQPNRAKIKAAAFVDRAKKCKAA
jgi:hypothetical protein